MSYYAVPKTIMASTKERANRLATDTPRIKYSQKKVYPESAENIITPLYTTKVEKEQFDMCMDILENLQSVSESSARDFARCVFSNVLNGLTGPALSKIDLSDYNISEDAKNLLTEGLKYTSVCQRILTNQDIISKRFNVDKVAKENIYRPERAINELCSLIDTYEIPPHYKMNIAMENVAYTLYKNGVTINESAMLDLIVEYFMDRDMVISDDQYKNYKKVLEENYIFSDILSDTSIAKNVLNNPGNYYSSMMNKVFSESDDSYISTVLLQEANNINTEADAYSFIEDISSYMDTNNLTEDEIARLGCAVNNISNYSP